MVILSQDLVTLVILVTLNRVTLNQDTLNQDLVTLNLLMFNQVGPVLPIQRKLLIHLLPLTAFQALPVLSLVLPVRSLVLPVRTQALPVRSHPVDHHFPIHTQVLRRHITHIQTMEKLLNHPKAILKVLHHLAFLLYPLSMYP